MIAGMNVRREESDSRSPAAGPPAAGPPVVSARLSGGALPGTPAWDEQFGRGWTIYVVSAMAAIAIGFVCLIRAGTPVARVHGVSIVVGLFASSFAGAALYCAVQRIGIPFGFYQGERLITERVIHPSTHPIGFPLLIACFFVLASLAIGGAVWMYVHADSVADYLLTHAEHS